jgi:hypothetical protein
MHPPLNAHPSLSSTRVIKIGSYKFHVRLGKAILGKKNSTNNNAKTIAFSYTCRPDLVPPNPAHFLPPSLPNASYVDLPERCKTLGLKSFSGYYFCCWCDVHRYLSFCLLCHFTDSNIYFLTLAYSNFSFFLSIAFFLV